MVNRIGPIIPPKVSNLFTILFMLSILNSKPGTMVGVRIVADFRTRIFRRNIRCNTSTTTFVFST